ncbi:MAG: EutN/CcmL family microcompartment protein [Pirellulales bacterium]
MRLGTVIGTVTLSERHPSLAGGSYRLVVPLSLDNLTGKSDALAEELVVYDDLGAGLGSTIAFSEGGEAAQPFFPNYKPLDAYNAAILDRIEITAPTDK